MDIPYIGSIFLQDILSNVGAWDHVRGQKEKDKEGWGMEKNI